MMTSKINLDREFWMVWHHIEEIHSELGMSRRITITVDASCSARQYSMCHPTVPLDLTAQ